MDTDQNSSSQAQTPAEAAELLLEAVPRLMRLIASEAQASGISEALTVSQLRALGVLARGQRLPSELARELRVTPATASEVADLLVRRGLVERGAHPEDRRVTLLRITPAGESLYTSARKRSLAALGSLLGRLTPTEAEALRRGLTPLLSILQEKRSGAEHVG